MDGENEASSSKIGKASNPSTSSSLQLTSKPARKQVSHREVENIRQSQDRLNQTGLTYNIWYSKYAGGENDDGRKQNVKSTTRVNIAKDSGYTRANHASSGYVCLFFARGYCPNGESCTFLHMLPNQPPDQGHDVFGREKFGTSREDMGGVGTIQRVNRTLYVGRIHEEPQQMSNKQQVRQQKDGTTAKWNGFSKEDHNGDGRGWNRSLSKNKLNPTEKVLYRHFSEFGEIDRIRVLHSRGCGFVTYVREIDAQFAKEAMMHQSLDHGECINLRWATDDPNPGAQKRDKREREQEGLQAIQANLSEEAREAGQSLLELEEAEDGPNGKRIKMIESEEDGLNGMDEEEYRRLVEENKRNWDEMEREDVELQEKALAEIEAAERTKEEKGEGETVEANGLLDKKSLDAFHALRQKQQTTTTTVQPQSALNGLANYGSDSEEE